jgi:hypothetical protein
LASPRQSPGAFSLTPPACSSSRWRPNSAGRATKQPAHVLALVLSAFAAIADCQIDSPVLRHTCPCGPVVPGERGILEQWSNEPGFPVIRRNGGHSVRIHRTALERWLEKFALASNPRPYRNDPPPQSRRLRPAVQSLTCPPPGSWDLLVCMDVENFMAIGAALEPHKQC